MKKILLSIFAVAALSASCTKFLEDAPIDFKTVEAPVVSIKTVADDAIDVTVTAKEGTLFFSYIVIKGPAGQIDAELLLKGKAYKESALKYKVPAEKEGEDPVEKTAAGVLDFSKKQTVKLSIGGLSSNSAYTVYAVASNAQGVVSEVAAATTTTTDGTAPQLLLDKVGFTEKDSVLVVAIPFDDPVVLSGKGSVTAYFYAIYTNPGEDGNLVEQKSFVLSKENECLKTDGKTLYGIVPKGEYTPGALVTFSFPAGVVTNALGADCTAFEDVAVNTKGESEGIFAKYKTVTFKLSVNEDGDKEDGGIGAAEGEEEEKSPEVFTDWKKLRMLSYSQSAYPLAVKGKNAKLTVSVVDANGRTVSYFGKNYGTLDGKKIAALLDEDPGYGTTISYTMAAGSFLDIYGNESEEFSVKDGYYKSYGYKVEDIIGTYTATGSSYFKENDITEEWIIEKSDNAEKGNVMITKYWGFTCSTAIYATFNTDSGILGIPDGQYFADMTVGEKKTKVIFACNTDSEGVMLQISVPEAGVLSGSDLWFGYYMLDLNSWGDLYTTFKAVRQ